MIKRFMSPTFSLIVATFGRFSELEVFLQSLTEQTVKAEQIQVIIVDQNDTLDLQLIIQKYQRLLDLTHIRSSKKGLSYNRNLGLQIAKGEIVAFPDDDCRYYPNTLESVLRVFEQNPRATLILGRIIDRTTGKSIIRNWPTHPKMITKRNFITHYSSITIFTKQHLTFDERLGVGTYFGSYEDADFIYRSLLASNDIPYDPSIEVWHPEQNIHAFSEAKTIQYGLGFGALARKHWSWVFAYLLLGVIAFHTFGLLKALIRQDKVEMRKRWLSITSRIRGFIEFPAKL